MADSADSQTPVEGDIKLMKIEAEAAIREVKYAVEHAEISSELSANDDIAFFNVRTKEGETFCVELSALGYRIVGNKFDEISSEMNSTYYETIYSLLDKHSPKYRLTFGEALAGKLEGLQKLQEKAANGADHMETEEQKT